MSNATTKLTGRLSDPEARTLSVVQDDCSRIGFSLTSTHDRDALDALVAKGRVAYRGHYNGQTVAL
jgi:hypothetical protein